MLDESLHRRLQIRFCRRTGTARARTGFR
ncbi:hypothetical protein NKJ02_22865 [Mesorhizobium sp. M0213]